MQLLLFLFFPSLWNFVTGFHLVLHEKTSCVVDNEPLTSSLSSSVLLILRGGDSNNHNRSDNSDNKESSTSELTSSGSSTSSTSIIPSSTTTDDDDNNNRITADNTVLSSSSTTTENESATRTTTADSITINNNIQKTENNVIISDDDDDVGSTTETITIIINKIINHPKFLNFRQRALPAVGLLLMLYVIVHFLAERGLALLLLFASPVLYSEAVSVLDTHHTHKGTNIFTNKWWWYISYSMAFSLPKTLHILLDHDNYRIESIPALCHFIAYTCITFGFITWIIYLNKISHNTNNNNNNNENNTSSTTEDFMYAWNEMAIYHMGILFTIIPVTFWMAVLQKFGMTWALYTALLVILNDTLAYIFGITTGKTAILPTISPKKTWEGWIGALLSTLVCSWPVWKMLFQKKENIMKYNIHSFTVALFCCIVAPFGGFMASSIKRASGKKDFGNLISGHGGLVDRLDCQLFAAPFLYLYLKAIVGTSSTTATPIP